MVFSFVSFGALTGGYAGRSNLLALTLDERIYFKETLLFSLFGLPEEVEETETPWWGSRRPAYALVCIP